MCCSPAVCLLPLAPQIEGSTRAFPKTKEQYVNWGDEDFMDGSRGSRCAQRRAGAWAGCRRPVLCTASAWLDSEQGHMRCCAEPACAAATGMVVMVTVVLTMSPLPPSAQVCEAAGAAHREGVHQQAVSGCWPGARGAATFCFSSPSFFSLLSCYTVQLLPVTSLLAASGMRRGRKPREPWGRHSARRPAGGFRSRPERLQGPAASQGDCWHTFQNG